jgi:DDE superfamily endonuclease
MAKSKKTDRLMCHKIDESIYVDPSSPRRSKTIIDTPRRVRLICDAQLTAGKWPRRELFKAHGVSEATGYRIIKSKSTRRSQRLHNRGRKPILAPHECDAVEAVENASFQFGTATHYSNAKLLGLADGSERAVQRNMTEHGVGTFMAQQKKYISNSSIEARKIWGFERRYYKEDHFKHFRYSDECHFACGLQRQARVHRRRGRKARDAPTKIQFRLKRRNQCWHVFAVIGWDYKSPLHFYTGSGVGGRLTQADYIVILEGIVTPDWDKKSTFVEDNDGPHGTRGKAENPVKAVKRRLGIKWEANPANSPDLNPIETIWRIVKQRLKSRGLITDPTVLRHAIEEEWDKITLKEINKTIASMPKRVAALNERNGLPIPF